MKTLFLDIDGVLITQRSGMCFEPMCRLGLKVLRGLSKGNVRIVVISQRRIAGYTQLLSLFFRAGFEEIDQRLAKDWATKDLRNGEETTSEALRATEILQYIREHGLNKFDCLVVDDLDLRPWFHQVGLICPDSDNGLTVEQARDILQWGVS